MAIAQRSSLAIVFPEETMSLSNYFLKALPCMTAMPCTLHVGLWAFDTAIFWKYWTSGLPEQETCTTSANTSRIQVCFHAMRLHSFDLCSRLSYSCIPHADFTVR